MGRGGGRDFSSGQNQVRLLRLRPRITDPAVQVTFPPANSNPLCLLPSAFQKLGVYNTSKTALLGLCKSLAVELAPKGIRVNCLVPGIIKTEFSQVVRISFCSPAPAPRSPLVPSLASLPGPTDTCKLELQPQSWPIIQRLCPAAFGTSGLSLSHRMGSLLSVGSKAKFCPTPLF